MDRNESHLAAKIGVEYRQFLEKKGYVLGAVSIDNSYTGPRYDLRYEPFIDKHTIRLSSAVGVLHEMTHVILKKDGIAPKTYEVGADFSCELPEDSLEVFRSMVVSGVPDYYVDTLLLQFLRETKTENLGGWIKSYFDLRQEHIKTYFTKGLPYHAKALVDRRFFDEGSINYFTISQFLFFRYSFHRTGGGKPDDFEPIIKKLAKEYPHLSHFFINRYALIKNSLITYPLIMSLRKHAGIPKVRFQPPGFLYGFLTYYIMVLTWRTRATSLNLQDSSTTVKPMRLLNFCGSMA